MLQQFLLLIAGFLLTTVVGGVLGTFFQTRTWTHQHGVMLEEQERARAAQIFEEVSRLLDKRLYRTRRVYWALDEGSGGDEHDAAVRKAWDDYRCILFEWNDGINRNLALLQQYFGANFRDRLDYEVGAQMVDIGKNLEAIARHHTYDSDLRQSLAERIDRLSGYIYLFNLEMLQTLQRRHVGGLMATNSERTSRGSNVATFGKALGIAGQARSRAVRESERRSDNRAP